MKLKFIPFLGVSATNTSQQIIDDEIDSATDYGINNVWGGIPAKNKKGENLLLFVGIIGKKHALQLYDHFALNTSCFGGST